MFLNPSSYVGIPCSSQKSDVVLYNPFMLHLLSDAEACIEIQQKKRHLRDLFSNREISQDTDNEETSWRVRIKNLNYAPTAIPPLITKNDFDEFMNSLTILPAEIFSTEWKRSLGSARHLNIGYIQLKGCGLTLPLALYEFEESSGLFDLHLALKSFMLSTLMHTVLPLGCSRGLSVCAPSFGRDKYQYGIYQREISAPRIAQLDHANAETLKTLLPEPLSFTYQLAAMTILGGRIPGTPDNILVNGQFIDEETWTWPLSYGQCHLYFDFSYESEENFDQNFETLPWTKMTLRTHTFDQIRSALKHFSKAHQLMNPNTELDPKVLEQNYLEHLQELLPELPLKEIFDRSFEINTQALLQKLKQDGWVINIQMLLNKGLGIILTKNGVSETSRLISAFNSKGRDDLSHLAKKLSFAGSQRERTEEVSNKLMENIGRSGYVLPKMVDPNGRLSENKMLLKDFLIKSEATWPLLKKCQMDMVAFDGNSEILIKNVSLKTELSTEVIPLYFITRGHGTKSHILPCFKTLLTIN